MHSFSVMLYVALTILFISQLAWASNEKCYSADPDCLDSKSVDITKGWDGSPRVSIDEVIDQATCDSLLEIATEYGIKGGTYPKDQLKKYGSPYTDAEYYSSIDLELLRQKGPAKAVIVEQIAANVKAIAKKYLDREKIDFELVDLQCRESVEGEVHEYEFSLGLHADYCAIQEDGSCKPYENNSDLARRTAVSYLYLNEVEQGGDLILTTRPQMIIDTVIEPRCGRLVTIDAGEYRAIQAVKRGRRCELAIWFKDVYFREYNFEYVPLEIHHMLPLPQISPGYDSRVRLVQENLIQKPECERLMKIATQYGIDLSTLKKSHSIKKSSDYNTDIDLNRLKRRKEVKREDTEFIQAVANLIKSQVEQHFKRRNLDFDLIALPCRIATGNEPPEDGISFHLHADNCLIQPDGSCNRISYSPRASARTISALLYLTDDIEGGELFLSDRPNKDITYVVKPECGKLAAYSSGEFHGVKAVTKGTRCALAMWFRQGN